MDEVLRSLVKAIERTETYYELWLVVPGAVLQGVAVSARRFMEEFEHNTQFKYTSTVTGEVTHGDLSETGISRGIGPDDNPEAIHLIDLALLSGGADIRLTPARVMLSAVSAWGYGRSR